MSTYYEYQDVKVMIAHKLMNMDGWKVYGYHEDQSDSMTDYYDPASWGGVAEKNGYILCVNVHGAAETQEIRKYNYDCFSYDKSIMEKIEKLKRMTVERGASEQEAESAKMMIARLQRKAEEATENRNKYVVVGMIPGHMENPPKMNWHIEKDGIIIAKGNGILKYAKVDSYYRYSHYIESLEEYKKDKKAYAEEYTQNLLFRGYYSDKEKAEANTERHLEDLEKDIKLIDQFEAFINKIDTTCGGLLGEGDGTIYEKVTVTEYKKELKPVETANGEIKEGQCFILKSNFNYGRYKGYVYRIHEQSFDDGQKRYYAYKLNGKKTKECTGRADQSNYWYIYDTEKFLKWFEKGAISWCELQEVKTPYEVEKVIKKTIKAEKKTIEKQNTPEASTEGVNINNYTFEVSEDTDTRTNERIYLVKVAEKLSREEYIKVNQLIKSLGGYWSRYKHKFLFKENPTEKLNAIKQENNTETVTTERESGTDKEAEKSFTYVITEDKHTKTDETIWIVKPEKQLNKIDFAEIKQKFATIQGYYSSFVRGFIFKYDPTEKLKVI